MSQPLTKSFLLAAALAIGPAVGPAIHAAAPATTPATQPTTIPTTIPATQAALPAGSRVTLNLNQVKPGDAFAELSKQIDYELRPNPRNLWESRPWPAIDVRLKDASFWQATRELCEKAGVSLQRLGIERDVVLMAGGGRPWTTYPASEHGPFLVTAHSLQRVHSIDLTQATGPTRTCLVRLMLYAEPKVKILRSSAVAQVDHAVDERGNSLTPPPVVSTPRPSFTTGWTWSVAASLSPPPDAGNVVAEMRGRILVSVQTASQIVRIPDIQAARNVVKSVAGHQLTVKEVRKTGSSYTVLMNLARDPSSAAVWRDVSPGSFFKLLDATGEPLTRRTYGGTGGGAAESVDLSLTFARENFNGGEAAGEAATLVWEVPTEVSEHSIPFVFRNIPLP